jgi:hypothetical protein
MPSLARTRLRRRAIGKTLRFGAGHGGPSLTREKMLDGERVMLRHDELHLLQVKAGDRSCMWLETA